MAGPWEDFQQAAPAAPADGPWTDFQEKKKSSLGGDIAKSAASGVARGVAGLAGLPVDFINAAGKAIGHNPEIQTGSSDQLTGAIEPYLHKSETTAGKYVGKAAEWLPAMAGGPETLLAKLGTRIAAPYVGSQVAGALAEGTPQEDLARLLGGAAAGGVAIHRAVGKANARAAAQSEADALAAKPLSEAGTAAHDAFVDAQKGVKTQEDVKQAARDFQRTDHYDNLHPDTRTSVDNLASMPIKQPSESSILLPLALEGVLPTGIPASIMGARAIGGKAAKAYRDRKAVDALEAIRQDIRRKDAGPATPADTAPTPAGPWGARPSPGTAVPSAGFRPLSPEQPAGPASPWHRGPSAPWMPPGPASAFPRPAQNWGGPASDVRLQPPQEPPTPNAVPVGPTPNLPARLSPGTPMGAAYEPASAQALPPQQALPPPSAVQAAIAQARMRALPPPASGAPINMGQLPIRSGQGPQPLGLPAPFVMRGSAVPPQANASAAEPTASSVARPALTPIEELERRAKPSAQSSRVRAEMALEEKLLGAARKSTSTPPASAPMVLAKLTKANGKVVRTPLQAPAGPITAPPAQMAPIPTPVRSNGPTSPLPTPESDGLTIPDFLRRNGPPASAPVAENAPVERLAHAAVTLKDGAVFTGTTHGEAFHNAYTQLGVSPDALLKRLKSDSQFVTTSGRVVDRLEAGRIASQAAQFKPTRSGGYTKAEDINLQQSLPAPALAAGTPPAPSTNGFAPLAREDMPFYGRRDSAQIGKESAAEWKAAMETKGFPPAASKLAAHASNVAEARPRLSGLVNPLIEAARGGDKAVLGEMLENMLHRSSYEQATKRYSMRDHFLAQLSDPVLRAAAKDKLTNDKLRGPRPKSKG